MGQENLSTEFIGDLSKKSFLLPATSSPLLMDSLKINKPIRQCSHLSYQQDYQYSEIQICESPLPTFLSRLPVH